MKIELLGAGCSKYVQLEEVVKQAIVKSAKHVELEKVEDIMRIMQYQVLSTPGLVVDGKVVSIGRVLSVDEVLEYIN